MFNNERLPPDQDFRILNRRTVVFLSFIISEKGRVTSATGIVPAFDRKIIVQWRSGIYPTYIREIALGIVQTYRDVV